MPAQPTTKPPTFILEPSKGRSFEWPSSPLKPFYLFWQNDVPESDDNRLGGPELLLVTANGITTTYSNVGLHPELKMSWLRVTEHVAIENPFSTFRGDAAQGLLFCLGIMAAWLKHQSKPDETTIPLDQTAWEKEYMPTFLQLRNDPSPSPSLQLKVLEGWAARANWESSWVWDVAAAALYDFRDNPLRSQIEKAFMQHVKKAGCDWRKIGDIADADFEPSVYVGLRTMEVKCLLENEPDQGMLSPICTDVVYPVRRSGSKRVRGFQWPLQRSDSFYVVAPQKNAHILCTPWNLQVFHPEYPVEPGEGFHFIRISEHLVLQLPARIPDDTKYHEILQGLGLTVAFIAYPSSEEPRYGAVLKNYNEWAHEITELVRVSQFKSPSDFHDLILPILVAWADHADGNSPNDQKVIVALARDLSGSQEWPLIIKFVAPAATARGFDFETLSIKGNARQTIGYKVTKGQELKYSLGEKYTPGKANPLLKELERRVSDAKCGRQQIEFPKWTVLPNSKIDGELEQYLRNIDQNFPGDKILWDLKKHGLA